MLEVNKNNNVAGCVYLTTVLKGRGRSRISTPTHNPQISTKPFGISLLLQNIWKPLIRYILMIAILNGNYFTKSCHEHLRQRAKPEAQPTGSRKCWKSNQKLQANKQQGSQDGNGRKKSDKSSRGEDDGGQSDEDGDDNGNADEDTNEEAEVEEDSLGGWLTVPRFFSGGGGRPSTAQDPIIVREPELVSSSRNILGLDTLTQSQLGAIEDWRGLAGDWRRQVCTSFSCYPSD